MKSVTWLLLALTGLFSCRGGEATQVAHPAPRPAPGFEELPVWEREVQPAEDVGYSGADARADGDASDASSDASGRVDADADGDVGVDDAQVTTAGPPAPPLEVRLSDSERAERRAVAEEDLAAARVAIEHIDRSTLNADQADRFEVLLDLYERSLAALEAGRVREAQQLAEKARVLAEDLGPGE